MKSSALASGNLAHPNRIICSRPISYLFEQIIPVIIYKINPQTAICLFTDEFLIQKIHPQTEKKLFVDVFFVSKSIRNLPKTFLLVPLKNPILCYSTKT